MYRYIVGMCLTGVVSSHRRYNVMTVDMLPAGDISVAESDPTVSITSLLDDTDRIIKRTAFGYTAELSDKTLERVGKHPKVAFIEEDKMVKIALEESSQIESHAAFVLQKDSPWGLSRVGGLTDGYEYMPSGGKDVTVYILDTGIDITHPEFEGRASFKYNAIDGSLDTDEHGHGTHCAGVVGSRTFGVAKKASLVAVKVLDKQGIGSISKLIEGIDFVIGHHWNRIQRYNSRARRSIPYSSQVFGAGVSNEMSSYLSGDYLASMMLRHLSSGHPTYGTTGTHLRSSLSRRPRAIINMSIGGEKSMALNYAIRYASKSIGIHFSTAAGNENRDACAYSPSSSSAGLTIGASNIENRVAQFSNQGKCVNVYAPGTNIPSSWPGNTVRTISGTSMATPHVSGIMAIYLGLVDFEPEKLKNRIVLDSIKIIDGLESSLWPLKRRELKPFASLKTLYDRIKAYESRHPIHKH